MSDPLSQQDLPSVISGDGRFAVLLGDVFHAVDAALLDKMRVTHLLIAASKCKLPPGSAERQVLTVPLPESGDCNLTLPGSYHVENAAQPTAATRLEQCLEFIAGAQSVGGRVLVLCSNGNNRAATIVAAWMLCSSPQPAGPGTGPGGSSLQAVVSLLRKRRPGVNIAKPYFEQLQAIEKDRLGICSVEEYPFS